MRGRGQEDVCAFKQILELKEVERAPSNMVRGQSWRALSGVAGTRRLLADMKDAKRPVRAKRMIVHVSNRVFRPDDVTKRQSGWLREILGPEGCPRTCSKTVTKR